MIGETFLCIGDDKGCLNLYKISYFEEEKKYTISEPFILSGKKFLNIKNNLILSGKKILNIKNIKGFKSELVGCFFERKKNFKKNPSKGI
jgi:hypothetical protein